MRFNLKMSDRKLCRICMRSDNIIAKAIDERLSDFYDEISDINVFANPMLTFCQLCEYKLRKFYNFKQKCLRSNYILKRKIADLEHMDLGTLMQLAPRDSIGFSMPSDRSGFFDYKCNDDLFTYLNSTPTENYQTETNKPDTITSEFDAFKDEVMIDTDLIKTEDEKILEDPITVNKDELIENMEEDKCMEINEFEVETIVENDSNEIDNSESDDNDDDEIELKKEYLSDIEKLLSENIDTDDPLDTDSDNEELLSDDEKILKPNNKRSTIKKESFKIDLSSIKTKTIKGTETNSKKITRAKNKEKDNSGSDDDEIELTKEYLSEIEKLLSENMDTDDPLDTDSDNEELLNDDEKILKPKNKRKTIKKESFKKDLSSIKTKTIKSKETNSKKVTQAKNKEKINMRQLELLQSDLFDLNDFSSDDLKCIKGLLPASEKKYVNFRIQIEEFKNSVVDLLEQGKIDLGEVKITKDMFLEMVAKCSINGFKGLGIAKRGSNIPKVKKFLLSLHKRFNPDYETVFKIEYLNTREKKLAEFESRKHSEEYIKATFKCEICFLPFSLKSKLDYHNNWHDLNRPHACDICSMRFTALSTLKGHQLNCHYTVYRCKLCPVFTYYSGGMFNHYQQHKGRLYTCDICLSQYSHRSNLNGHRLSHARLSCEVCRRRFHSQRVLDKHMELKHANEKAGADEATLSCDQCDAVFKTDLHRRRHMRKHEVKSYNCVFTYCYERFSSASELREHARSSGHVRRPTEAKRDKTCSANVGVVKDKSNGICPVCGDQIVNSSRRALYKHHRQHHPNEPYQIDGECTLLCEHCGKAFKHHSIYLDHLNTHTGAKPYECKECGARFSMRLGLRDHSERHGAPRHQCKDCGKKFKSASNLCLHRRTHIGDRRYKCTVCDKGFIHAGSLKEHINGVHEGIRRDKRRVRKQTDK